jgi:hypothetical protein
VVRHRRPRASGLSFAFSSFTASSARVVVCGRRPRIYLEVLRRQAVVASRRVAVASRRGRRARRERRGGAIERETRARTTTTTMSGWDVRARRDDDGDGANERTNERTNERNVSSAWEETR